MNLGKPIPLYIAHGMFERIRSVVTNPPTTGTTFILLDIIWPIKQHYEFG